MVFVGLGNPGPEYEATRHNLGFMVLDDVARTLNARFRNKGDYCEARVQLGDAPARLVKPMRYVNNSGLVVRDYLNRNPDEFLVVCDDLSLPFGRIRLRTRGSDGGHQGLADIIYRLETNRFPRVRVGISPQPLGMDAADYVLARFNSDEQRYLPDIIRAGRDAVVMVAEQGITRAMNRFNPMHLIPEPDSGGATPDQA